MWSLSRLTRGSLLQRARRRRAAEEGRLSRRTVGVLVAVSVGLAAAWLLVGRPKPTDEEQIRSIFTAAARAVEEKRASEAVAAVSERFLGDGLDKRELKRFIAAQLLRGEWVSVTVAGARVRVEGDAAEAVVDVVMARSGKGRRLADLLPADASANRITCRLLREEGSWRVVAASRRVIALAEIMGE